MNIKKIMLITFLLLAVLTIGAVSATDDTASDNITVSDDENIIINDNYDPDEHYIEANEEKINLNNENEEIAYITLPDKAEGSFQIFNNNEKVAHLDVNKTDKDHWEINDGELTGTIFLKDVNLTKITDGDELTFKFSELKGGQYVEVESFTQVYKVSITGSTMQLLGNEDVDIKVTDIDYKKPDENFTNITVTQKEGIFIITIEGEDDDIEILKEDLSTTKRHYIETDDGNGNHFYSFGFSFNDINNYIAKNIKYANTFQELIDNNLISSGYDIYFELYDDEDTEIYSKTMIYTLTNKGVSFEDDEDEPIEVEYGDLDIIMYDNWQETEIIDFTLSNDITGKIVIYLNDNKTPAFEKNIADLTPYDDDESFNYYTFTISDLNITKEGEYTIHFYFYDDNDKQLYPNEDDEPETLTLYEPQILTVGNVTIEVNPIPATITGNESFITIDANARDDNNISVYINGNETAKIIKLGDCRKDETGNYLIGSKELDLGVGKHELNIIYKNSNLIAKVNLASNLVIDLPEANEKIYTTFNYEFVFISLDEDEDIYESNVNGTVNLTIKDNDGNTIATLEKDIMDLTYNKDIGAYIIRTKDVNTTLSGNYTVIVRYFDGNEAATQAEGNVIFKSFESSEYGTSIKDAIKNESDYVITFTDIATSYNVIVEVDGNKSAEIRESTLNGCFDSQKRVYYIKYDKIMGLSEGFHSVNVYLDTDIGHINLANSTVIVDLKEDIDPGLTISIANVEEGNPINVLITTNATFTGEVLLQVANANYTVNITKGQGNITIEGLKADTYTATAIFKSNGIFNDSVKTIAFTVTSNPVPPAEKTDIIKLTLKKVKIKKSAKKLVLKASLKINGKAVNGKKITFKFKGKTYKAKTNKKGVAKATVKKKVLKKLKVGKKITYTASYLDKTVKKTVKVKK